ncbi:hypothetical protein [Rhizobium leguminosarum]|uniref:hypothetical protein n=1 Tax=Rhizobium leguminosarum TaxID=384 RepID=UPI000E2F7A06|nr:hypothetical protein [Rhizobium leguminosarum]
MPNKLKGVTTVAFVAKLSVLNWKRAALQPPGGDEELADEDENFVFSKGSAANAIINSIQRDRPCRLRN